MKYVYTLFLSAFSLCGFAQFEISTGYSASAPRGAMNDNINLLHSLHAEVAYRLPGAFSRLQPSIDIAWGTYANTRKMQTFNFGNGTSTRTWVNYSSNVVQAGIGARLFILEKKQVMPFLSGKTGYAGFYSNIFIEDPHDPDGCRALDQRNLIKDGTIYGAYGGGLRVDLSLFKPSNSKGRGYIDFSVNKMTGGNIEYINTKKLIDAANPPSGGNGKPLSVPFINATTQQIHEHQVAEVFTTPLRMMEYKVSAVFPIGHRR